MLLFASISLIGCISEKDFLTAEGFVVPGRHAFDLDYYEHRCQVTVDQNVEKLQDLLNLYGNRGWLLQSMTTVHAGIMFCVAR